MRFLSTSRRLAAMLMAVPLACALAGCAGPSDSPSVPPLFKSEIDQALADPEITDFQRQVLSDYVVTDAEYAQAKDLYVQCMADRGWTVTLGEGGSMSIVKAPGSTHASDDSSTDHWQCMDGTTYYIEAFYIDMRENPQGFTRAQQIRACYERNGVPDGSGMTDDEFEKMVTDDSYHASTPQGKVCYWDPTGSASMTQEEAEQADANRITITATPQPGADPHAPIGGSSVTNEPH